MPWGKGVSLSVPHFLPSMGHGLVRINLLATTKVLVQGQGCLISAVVITYLISALLFLSLSPSFRQRSTEKHKFWSPREPGVTSVPLGIVITLVELLSLPGPASL